ncbi:MAG: hypothetical protein KAV42_03610, partial [Candidatus Krumholzibacteria bacterium]|nr:hypothetical protein [Candidatus Krumholzibacteria bacterium]
GLRTGPGARPKQVFELETKQDSGGKKKPSGPFGKKVEGTQCLSLSSHSSKRSRDYFIFRQVS